MDMNLLEQELTRDEGVRSKVYYDSLNIPTIGIGRNLRDKGLSPDEISYLFANDIKQVCAELDAHVPWWRNMSDARQRVLCNMCFNLGLNGVLGFVNTLVAMQQGRYEDAADGMAKSKWDTQVGARADRLEAMMREG